MIDYWNRLSGRERKDKKLRYNKLYQKIMSGGGGEGTRDYNELDPESLPKIENSIVKGSKTAEYYGLAKKSHKHSVDDISGLPPIVTIPKKDEVVRKSDDDGPVLLKSPKPTSLRSLSANELTADPEPELSNKYDEYLLIDGNLEKIGIDEYPELFKLPKIEGVIVVGDKSAADYNLVSLTNLETVMTEVRALIESKQAKLVSGTNIKKLSIDDAEIDLLGEGTVVIPTGGTGASSYKSLPDQPTVEGNTLVSSSDGDNSANSLGLATKEHTHNISDVADLSTELGNKADTSAVEGKQDKLVSGTNIRPVKIGDGSEQSLLGSEVLNIPTDGRSDNERAIISFEDLNPHEYAEGVFWITGDASGVRAKILKVTDSTKHWDNYPDPLMDPGFPDLSGVSDGTLLVVTDTGLKLDCPVFIADKTGTPKWVRLDKVNIQYADLPDKPSIKGVTLVGNKTADYYDLATKEHTHNISDVADLSTELGNKADTSVVEGKQDKLVNGENIVQLKFNEEIVNLAGSGVVEVSTAGDYPSLPGKPKLNGVELNGNVTLEQIGLVQSVSAGGEDYDEFYFGSIACMKEYAAEKSSVTAIENKICTDFYKTSTIKSPCCKAIADYIDEVLAGLDGSEVAF